MTDTATLFPAPVGRGHRVAVCLVGALLLHGAAATLWSHAGETTTPASTVRMRLVSLATQPAPASNSGIPPRAGNEPRTEARHPRAEPARDGSASANGATALPPAPPRAEPAEPAEPVAAEYTGEEFLPEDQLSVLPTLLDELPPMSAPMPADTAWRLPLLLFIDAHGRVSRVDIEASPVPTELLDAVQAALGAASFRPGQVGGMAVNASVRMEAAVSGQHLLLSPRSAP